MRVLQAMAGAPYGGAEAFFTRLVIALHQAGLEQRVLMRPNEARETILQDNGIRPMLARFGGALDITTRYTFKSQIKDFKPDIVMTWMNRATHFCPSTGAKGGEKGSFVHIARLGGYYDLKYYKSCDHLIGNTEDIVQYLTQSGWPQERAHYLPNFVAGKQGKPIDRGKLYTPKNTTLILGLGRLHPNKAFDTLLEAVSRVPNTYLWIAGEGPEREKLESLAEKLAIKPRVRFLGWREDAADLLATCDIFVCPSRHEPLGNVVIEAWAQSKPVVAADGLGPGTLIEHMETGLLVPVDDAPMMGRAIRHVIENDDVRERIARQGNDVYQEHFMESQVVDKYMSFFEERLKD
ncbi:MAG: glycosyltransferase [Rhodospirillaceae bacterium]|jgi:glycosyltransferase involved in cell wall biosynthesis